MRQISTTIIEAKNQQSSSQPWLVLLDVEISDDETKYWVANPEAVTFNGHVYQPFGYRIDDVQQTTKGDLTETSVSISNVTQQAAMYVLTHEMRGRRVVMTGVYYGALNTADVVFEERYRINEISGDSRVITIKLGYPPLLEQPCPNSYFWRDSCRLKYKTDRACGFVDGSKDGSGIVNWNAETGRVVGTLTKFLSEFVIGDSIRLYGEDVMIQSVISETEFVPVAPPTTLPWTNEPFAIVKPTCSRSLRGPNGCRAHKNNQNFGAFWGIPSRNGTI